MLPCTHEDQGVRQVSSTQVGEERLSHAHRTITRQYLQQVPHRIQEAVEPGPSGAGQGVQGQDTGEAGEPRSKEGLRKEVAQQKCEALYAEGQGVEAGQPGAVQPVVQSLAREEQGQALRSEAPQGVRHHDRGLPPHAKGTAACLRDLSAAGDAKEASVGRSRSCNQESAGTPLLSLQPRARATTRGCCGRRASSELPRRLA